MARTRQITRIISLLPFAFVLFATRPANAESGVTITVWNNQTWNNQYNSSPPLPPTTPVAGQLIDTDASHNFDQQPLFNLFDDFVVLFEGWITAPTTGTVNFLALADDGTQLYVNGQRIINDWYDKGGGGSISSPVQMTAGEPQPFHLWFYENGGGAWVQLWWQINNQWQEVPASAFTTTGQTTTVPTTLPETTTTTSTTTTVPITTTTQTPETTTTVQQSTTTTSSSTTTSLPESTTTTVPATSLPVPASSTSTVQQTVPATTVPANPTTTVDVIADVTTTTQPEQTTTTTQPIQEPTWSTLPDTPDFQSATLVRGGAIGKGLKPTRLISNGLREGVTPAQQRMAVTAAVMIAIPSPITVSRRKT